MTSKRRRGRRFAPPCRTMKTTPLDLYASFTAKRPAPVPPTSVSAALADQLERLYALAQNSTHVFASPLGPVDGRGGKQFVPRFVYFGPHSSDVSVRLSFLAGFRRDELFTTLALLHFIEQLATAPSLGEQLSLSFFPLVDGDGSSTLGIAGESWARSTRPEIDLLVADTRQRNYDGFVRLEATEGELMVVRLRTSDDVTHPAPAVELINDADVVPFAVRWEYEPMSAVLDGPLSLGAELTSGPFELTFRFPRHWTLQEHQAAASSVLARFIRRYRAFVAYGLHL